MHVPSASQIWWGLWLPNGPVTMAHPYAAGPLLFLFDLRLPPSVNNLTHLVPGLNLNHLLWGNELPKTMLYGPVYASSSSIRCLLVLSSARSCWISTVPIFSITCPGPMLALDNSLDVDCTSAKFLDSFRPFGLPALVTCTHVWPSAPLSATGVSVWTVHSFFLRRSLL